MLNQPLEPILLAAILGIAAALYGWLWWTRLRIEFRAQLGEMLALGCRRGRPLEPVFGLVARDVRGRNRRRMQAIETRLKLGESLSMALAAGGSRWFPPTYRKAIAAAEGRDGLGDVLEVLAKEDQRRLATQSRISIGLCYPAILVVILATLHALVGNVMREPLYWSQTEYPSLSAFVLDPILVIGGGLIALALLGGAARRRGWLPGGGTGALSHVLHLTATLQRGGMPPDTALRRAADATAHRSVARRARRAADALAEGAEAAWRTLGVSEADAVRLASAEPPRVARLLTHLAERLGRRAAERVRRLVALAYPTSLALVGFVVFVQFKVVVDVWLQAQHTARLW